MHSLDFLGGRKLGDQVPNRLPSRHVRSLVCVSLSFRARVPSDFPSKTAPKPQPVLPGPPEPWHDRRRERRERVTTTEGATMRRWSWGCQAARSIGRSNPRIGCVPAFEHSKQRVRERLEEASWHLHPTINAYRPLTGRPTGPRSYFGYGNVVPANDHGFTPFHARKIVRQACFRFCNVDTNHGQLSVQIRIRAASSHR